MKCPNPECLFSGLEKFEETANFCPRCGWNLGRSEEASSSLNEKNTSMSKNSTPNASESEDRRFDPQDSTVEADRPCKKTVENLGKQKPGEITSSQSLLEDTTTVAPQSFCLEKKAEENQEEDHDLTEEISRVPPSDCSLHLSSKGFARSSCPVEADGPCKETVEHLGKQKPGEITSSQSLLEDTTAVASQSFCLEEKTEENQEEDHDPTKEISHVSPSDSTLNLSCEEFASSNSPVQADGPCKETVEHLGKQKPGEITSSQSLLEDTTAVASQTFCHEKKTEENQEENHDPKEEISCGLPSDSTLNLSSEEFASSNSPVEADGPCKEIVEHLGKQKPGEITSSQSLLEDTTAVASRSFSLEEKTEENQEEDHDPTKEISHVSPGDSTLNLSCEEFASSNSPVEADRPCKKTLENLGEQKPGEITSSQSLLEDTTAVASQSFCLEEKTEENQEEGHDPKREISHVSPSDSTLNLSSEEFASSNSPEDTPDDDRQDAVGSTAEAVAYTKAAYPSKTDDSSKEIKVFPATDDGHKVGSQSMNSKAEAACNDSDGDKNTNDADNQYNRDVASLLPNDSGSSQSKDSHTGTVSSQRDNGSICNNTDDTDDVTVDGSNCQETVPGHLQRDKTGIKSTTFPFFKSRSQKKREKKKERKRNRERERKEEAQLEPAKNESKKQRGVSKPGPVQKEMSDNVKKNSDISVPKQLEDQTKGNHTENSVVEKGGNNDGNNANSEYFWKEKGGKMTVVFYAVLAPHFKFAAREGDRIFMRFGGPAFGSFNDNVVEVHPGRMLEDDFILVQAELLIPCSLLPRNIPYKYIVVKANSDYSFEHLVGLGNFTNRCLLIPKERCKAGDVWHQYDDTIFSPPTWFQSFRNMLPAALKSMNAAEGRRIATRAMLPSLEGFTEEGNDTSAWKAVEVIHNLASCMTSSQVEDNGRYLRNVPASYKFEEVLKQYLKERILQNSLLSSDAKDKNTTWNRLLSSIIITYVVHVFKVCLDLDDYRKLFSSLVLSGNLEEKTCPAFDVLVRHFDIQNWRCLGEAIQAICKDVAKKGLNDWFCAVPLVHFLTGASKPFSKDVLLFEEPKKNDDSWWGAVGFETKTLRERSFPESSCLMTWVNSLWPLFELDPLFRRTFLLATPCSAYDKIASSGRFCPLEVYTTLAKILSEEKFIHELQREKVASSLKITRENATKTTSEIAPHGGPPSDLWAASTQEAILCAKSCLYILKTVSSSCKFYLLLECLRSMAMWVAVLEKVPSLEVHDAFTFKEMENMVKETIDAVKKWLKKSLSGQIPCYTTADTNQELQMWTNLLDLGWGSKICNELWSCSFSEAFKFRLEVRDCNALVEVLTKAEITTQNNCVRDLVSNVTFRKVEDLLQWGNESKELFENLWKNGLNSPEASNCGELFTLMLTRCWPKPKGGIPCSSLTLLKHVLEWKLWPCFFHRFGPESVYREVIKVDGLEILVLAESSLGAAIGFLKDGSIELQMLEVIIEHSEQFLRLSELISDFKIENLLHRRNKELRAFRSEQAEVSCFIRMCALIKQVDLGQLSTKSGVDTSRSQIKDLVESKVFEDTVIPKVTFFGLSRGAKMMVSALSKLSDSALLRQFWKQKGEELGTTKERLTVDDVEELVWTPSHEHLLSLKDRFLDGSISFEEVDKILAVFMGNDEGLIREICLITSQTSPQIKDARAVIGPHIEKINQYRNLQNCIDAAESMLVFKNCFELQGDFQLVEDLKNQMGREFKRRPLKSMSPDLQATGESLSRITPNGRRCLDAVVKCQKFIAWLQKTIKGPQELKVLVDLAIISAAETDIETARITCLHTSCLGFAPLIFVKPDFRFDDVMKACKPVWDAVESDPHLPQKLIDTSRQLEWLKGVETSHGSVAKSSLLDAQAINESGIYRVGCPSKDGSFCTEKLTVDKVIQLSVPQENCGEHKCYSLDDLKDLQSKLMLIAAKASQGKEEVDRFVDIFQSVVRLGEAYISLCKAGEVSHLKWTFEFKCTARLTGSPSQAKDLASQSDEMEECLKLWKNELHQKRLHYKELNHYTTMQLLVLRSELANLRGRGPKAVDDIPLEVYNLLESAHPGVEPGILKSTLVSCGICSQETGQSILMSFGGSCTIQQSAFGKQLVSVKNLQSSQEEVFQSLVANLESIGSYSDPEEIAIAAMLSCKHASETDLIVWCVKNGNNEDLIRSKYSEALQDPRYCALIDKDACVSIKGESPYEKETSVETEDLPHSMDTTFILDQTADGEFLSLDDLGKVLTYLASMGPKRLKRRPSKYLIPGKPNFVVIPKDDIFGTVLSLYMHDNTQSLPSSEEVLICTSDTTAEEIELLWRRCLGNHDGGLFCLVNVDLLDYSVSQKAANTLSFLLQEYNSNEELCLVIFCSSENEDRAHMAAALDQYRLGTMPYTASPKEIRQYLKTQFKACPQKQARFRDQNLSWTPAGTVDKEKMSVRVFSSERAGSGKTLAVHRLNQNLRQLRNNDVVIRYFEDTDTDLPLCIAIPIYGPAVNHCSVVESFLPHIVAPDLPLSRIFHIDVHPSVTNDLDTLLFNLLVLGVLKSSSGKVWRRRASDLYVIELTTGPTQGFIGTEEKKMSLFKNTRSKKRLSEPFHALLPTIYCGTPEQALLELKRNAKESLNPRFDDGEFRSQHFQRAFQYLKLWETAKQDLDHFWFVPNNTMGDYADCLEILMRNCGIMDPSWAELRHFVNFLNSQLQSCEESTFCNMEHVGDTLEGFRSFVVNFMILMSRDFATPSLDSTDLPLDTDYEDEEEHVEAAVTQFCLRRHWETSSHPYIFFNADCVSMTFVGFHIDQKGNLIDPDRRVIIKRNLMSRHLRTGLSVQFQFGDPKMSFETNYRTWSKGEKIQKLCGVMGVEWPYDPDNSYELTTDNLMKILAIHMRFRCGIPVIIMGETGCGKTCLIRYMCGLQSGPGGPKNMLLMKVHGGTTYEDIAKKVEIAEEMASQNEGLNIDTVLFFDEANTTDALGMIKEVMVDRRVNGRKIKAKRLQFIAACNPYRKHTKEMIHKLESAGLGYHVAAQQTRDRLGRIPLRHLVYRVHSLPASMRPLIWDFGQLKPEVEQLYTCQIVHRFVLQENQIPGDLQLVKALTAVLTASQRFMRDQEDECSFVSLRDVERTMKVMVWFYNHLDALGLLMESEEESDDVDASENELDDVQEDPFNQCEENFAFDTLGHLMESEEESDDGDASENGLDDVQEDPFNQCEENFAFDTLGHLMESEEESDDGDASENGLDDVQEDPFNQCEENFAFDTLGHLMESEEESDDGDASENGLDDVQEDPFNQCEKNFAFDTLGHLMESEEESDDGDASENGLDDVQEDPFNQCEENFAFDTLGHLMESEEESDDGDASENGLDDVQEDPFNQCEENFAFDTLGHLMESEEESDDGDASENGLDDVQEDPFNQCEENFAFDTLGHLMESEEESDDGDASENGLDDVQEDPFNQCEENFAFDTLGHLMESEEESDDGDASENGLDDVQEDPFNQCEENFAFDTLGHLMESEEESDDGDASENGLDDVEEDPLNQPLDEITLALVLSLGVCYHARLQDRKSFRRAVAPSFSRPCLLPGGHRRILHEITRCQKAVLDELELDQNIARNTALSENVFMMVVCIELRIPLFVVGKPGSSKSLAKAVVAGNMEGDASKSDLFKTFKQVHMVSYQCSPLSTAEGIKATFRQCSQLQEAKNPDKFVSVVVLDEVGLAEDSPLMPLKTLHPLLEDGVSSTDDILEVEEQTRERVAFIGISNWALDPAKMNRGIMLSRGIPDTEELVDSAKGICSTTDERVQNLVEPLMEPLALGYKELYESQRESEALVKTKKDEFFGLRDFYSLVKMVYKIVEKLNREPAWKDIERAIRRNFGGLDEIDPVEIFRKHLPLGNMRGPEPDPDELSAVNLIKASLQRQITRGESRYLLVLTENYAALPIVLQELHKKREEPIVIFGSSFPKDQEFTQVCRDINRIKVCMETGRTVILLNLESLYESLYDALNQYYVYFGGQKYVDLGLGSHRVKCRVADKFRLIVIAERDVVYNKFPIPLINRLEKHYLVISASLNTQQKNIVGRIHEWVLQFSTVNIPRHQQMRTYTLGDSFVGYHADTAASVVRQVTKDLYEDGRRMYDNEEEVFRQSQELLLQCATPDAVARLPCTQLAQQADRLWSTYFTTQEHSSLTAFLKKVLTTEERGEDMGSLIQITTHSRLLSSNDLQHVAASTLLNLSNILCLSLQQFQTEQQFCLSVRDFLAKLGGREGLLIVQCDAGDINGNLIPCARHLLVEERASAVKHFKETVGHDLFLVHIVMIVQLPRFVGGCQTFAGFQGGRWVSVHIDELRPPTGQIPAIEFMVDRPVSKLFDVAPSTTQCQEMEVGEEEQEPIDVGMETSDHASNGTVLDKVDVISLLRSCIQAAVARIDDESRLSSRSTRRIEVMLNLLPDDRSQDTNLSFATILARRIHRLLEEKDERAGAEAGDWLRSEALSGTGIQESGTFRKALWQRVYSSVIPILSEVIAVVDRDSNLELVSKEGNWLSRLWIAFFQHQTLVELHYENFLSLESGIIRERAPVTTSGHERHIFGVQFPFSWLIKERIDAMWKEATSIAARRNNTVQQCLHDLISASEIGPLIEKAQEEGYGVAAVLRYLHDFVHMVHKPTVPDGEEKLISKAIITAARELYAQSHSSEDFSLSIPVVHVAHGAIEKRLSNLSHLIKCQPDIVTNLLQDIPSQESEMVYDAVALQLCLSTLTPYPEEFDDPQTRLVWCNRVLAVRPSAENLLNSSTTYGAKTTSVLRDCRSIWQRASAVRLFIEHTCPGTLPCHPADVKNAFKLWKALGDETDFSKPETIRVIETFLVHCSEAVSKRCIRHAVQEHFDFRRRCNSFFMDLVSLFCFGSEAGMIDSDLFTIFMSYVLEARSKTKDFSPFPEYGIDATPVVRSFLLQQLLRNSDEEVKKHLSHYMSEARGLRPDAGHLLQVCQLFVHCCEDSIISQYAKLSNNLPAMIKLTQQLCVECSPSFTSSGSEPEREVDVVLLENVAKGRYVLGLTAEFMTLMEEEGTWDNLLITRELLSLIESVKTMCCKSTASSAPRLYLLKQLTRRFGVEVIHTLCERRELDWIVPLESRAQQEEDLFPDRFIIYGESYKKIREAVAKTVLSGSHRELIATLESVALPPVARDVMLLLAEYREVTTCYRFTTAERRLSARGHEVLEEFLQDGTNFSDRVRPLAVHLLNNTLGPPGMPSTRAAPGRSVMEENLAELVIHTVTVLQCINHVTVCEPLRLMMENPAALRNTFLPTMPEDNLLEAMAGMTETGSWYQCPKGHPYYIGDCGRPVEVKVCPECRVNIGGIRHDLSTGNTVAQRADRTMKGHVLGDPAKRPKSLAPERSLSSVVVGITRILMHCALIEGACRQPQHVSALVNPTVPPAQLSRFLWDHLQLDVELLAKSLGRSVEETILCVHMILACMTAHVSNLQQSMIAAPNLTSKDSRKDWETAFSSSVVGPTLTNLEDQIQHCHELMVGDNRLANNPLMRQLYEVDVPADSLTGGILSSCPALWRYRTQVTVDHFSHTFQQEVFSTNSGRNKVLAEFLQQEHKLRALRFLPDIVKLQRLLMDQFHRRIDRTKAENISIRDFLKKDVTSKSTRGELAPLIASFNKAWNLVRLNLDQQGRLRPPSDLCQTPMDNSRPLGLLLPNTSGMGICSLALVFYLTTVHNEFNERYQHLVGGKVEDLPHIPLQDVASSQLISYDAERDLLPLILAQCNYSLEVGKGTLVQYNWDTLERQLIDRFIRGRPLIDFKDERFAFSRDIQLDSVFAAVKLKVRQHPLNSTVSRQIITEIRSLTDICDVLSSLDIAIGFLSSTGGMSDMLLEEYLRDILRMEQQNCLRSLKAQQCCQLRHVVSFWRLLSLERARILIARGQDPFELIPDTYKHVIPTIEMMKLSDAMKRIDLDSFVGEVLELILLNLRMEPSAGEKEMSLGDFIQWHLDNKGHDPIQGLDQWPDNVKLKHVIAAWRTSVELNDSYYDKREAASA